MTRDAVSARTLDMLSAIRRAALVPAVALVLAVALAVVCHPPKAFAGSNDSITLSAYAGPVGAQVTAALNISLNPPATYVLDSTATSPDGGGCDTASPIPGVARISVGSNGGSVTFAWPSSLDGGPYWLCATSQDGTPNIHSTLPFTVTSSSGATATPGGAPAGQIVIEPPASGAFVPGSSLTASFTTDDTIYGNTPLSASFVSPASGAAVRATYTILSATDTTYSASITIPDLPPGQYTLIIEGPEINGGKLASNPIMVVAPTPTPTAELAPAPLIGTQAHTVPPGPGVSGGVVAAAAAGLLLAVGLALLIVPPLRRRGNQPPR